MIYGFAPRNSIGNPLHEQGRSAMVSSMKEEHIRKLIQSAVCISELFASVREPFYRNKLRNFFDNFLSAAFHMQAGDSVAQSSTSQRLRYSLEMLSDLLNDLDHLGLARLTPLLAAQKSILEYLANVQTVKKETNIPKEQKIPPASPSKPLSVNQEKIFNFIRTTPNVRTKDIIDEFRSLSERTVKRSLKELTQSGLIRKRAENKAVYYS